MTGWSSRHFGLVTTSHLTRNLEMFRNVAKVHHVHHVHPPENGGRFLFEMY